MIQDLRIKLLSTKVQRGFTLIEMLIYMGVLSLLLTIMLEIFSLILNIRLNSEATSSVEQDGNYIMARLTEDIKDSANIVQPLTTDPASNTLQIKSTNNSINYTYDIDGNKNLELVNNTTSEHIILNSANTSVKSVSFKTLGNVNGAGAKDTVQIILVLQPKAYRANQQYPSTTFTTTVQEREIQ